MLLFDEGDVSLQERSVGADGMWDLARNEVVAVFFRWVMLAGATTCHARGY